MTKHPERLISYLCRMTRERVEGLEVDLNYFMDALKKKTVLTKMCLSPMPYYCMICVQRLKPCYVNRYSLIGYDTRTILCVPCCLAT